MKNSPPGKIAGVRSAGVLVVLLRITGEELSSKFFNIARCRSATTTDNAQLEFPMPDLQTCGPNLRTKRIPKSSVNHRRQSRRRHRQKGTVVLRPDRGQGAINQLITIAAIDSNGRNRMSPDQAQNIRNRTVGQLERGIDRTKRHQDRRCGPPDFSDITCRAQRHLQIGSRANRFNEQAINAPRSQGRNLLAVLFKSIVMSPKRSARSKNETRLFLASRQSCFGKCDRSQVDLFGKVSKVERRKVVVGSTERIRDDQFGPRLDITPVNLRHPIGVGQIQVFNTGKLSHRGRGRLSITQQASADTAVGNNRKWSACHTFTYCHNPSGFQSAGHVQSIRLLFN